MIQFTRRALIISGFELYWYGLLIALGAFAGCLLAMRREKRLGLQKDASIDLVLLGTPIAVIFARAYYVLFSWDYYRANPMEIIDIRDGGIAIYGAILGAMLAGWIYSRWKKLPFLRIADLAAPSLALGQCIGRWGNFVNQEAYGMAVENPSLQFFPLSVYIPDSGWHCATFFYESAWCALIVILLLIGEKRSIFKRKGDVFFAYAFLYGIERTVVEGLRTDSLYLGSMRVSQLLSLLALIAILIMLVVRMKKRAIAPLVAVLFMAIFIQSTLATLAFGLIALILAAAIYIKDEPVKNG